MELGKIIKTFKSRKDHQVVIRCVCENDTKSLLGFVNGLIAEDTFVMVSGKPMTLDEEKKYLDDAIEKIKKDRKIHLVAEVDGNFAGSGEVRIFDKRKSHVGEIGISLGAEYREEGIGSEFLQVLINEAKKVRLKLLTLNCFENNERALHTYEKVGFKKAGSIPGMLFYREKYIGEIIMYLPL
jgi:RimJ/RimL family protein N-acetyltransferase